MFYLFAGEQYYPSGGAEDFVARFASLDDAIARGRMWWSSDPDHENWWHVTNDLMENVASCG